MEGISDIGLVCSYSLLLWLLVLLGLLPQMFSAPGMSHFTRGCSHILHMHITSSRTMLFMITWTWLSNYQCNVPITLTTSISAIMTRSFTNIIVTSIVMMFTYASFFPAVAIQETVIHDSGKTMSSKVGFFSQGKRLFGFKNILLPCTTPNLCVFLF